VCYCQIFCTMYKKLCLSFHVPLKPLNDRAAKTNITVSEAKPANDELVCVCGCLCVHICVLAWTWQQTKDQTAIIKPEYHHTLSNGH